MSFEDIDACLWVKQSYRISGIGFNKHYVYYPISLLSKEQVEDYINKGYYVSCECSAVEDHHSNDKEYTFKACNIPLSELVNTGSINNNILKSIPPAVAYKYSPPPMNGYYSYTNVIRAYIHSNNNMYIVDPYILSAYSINTYK